MSNRAVITTPYDFLGHQRPPVVGSPDGTPWRKKLTGAGPPTVGSNGGFMDLALEATNEAQVACLYFGNDLSFDIDNLLAIRFWAKVTASLNAACSLAMGLAVAQNDTIGSIAQCLLFRAIGNNNIVIDTKDGTHTNAQIATGQTLVATTKKFEINFAKGLSDVRFFMDNADGNLRQVAPKTTFDLSAYAAGLQPYFQMQKSAATAVGTASIQRVEIDWRQN